MVTAAMSWARSKGLTRRNEVHGKDEFRVPTDFNFKNSNIDRTNTKTSGDFEIEARCFLVVQVKTTPIPASRVDEGFWWAMARTSHRSR